MPFIQPKIKQGLYNYIAKVSLELESKIEIINGTKDHVHILVCLSRKIAMMTYVQKIKGLSSSFVKAEYGEAYNNFFWQRGYGAFSVNPDKSERLILYIRNQEMHHRNSDFKKEYLKILNKYDAEYDLQHLWD